MPIGLKKKTRRNKFSQMVAEHFQFPKRRRSMVVETGFPTSLIDLYVRNCGQFRKSSEKKHRQNDEIIEEDLVVVGMMDSNNSLSRCYSDCRRNDEIIGVDSKTEAERGVGMGKFNPVLVVLLLMVVLVVGSKIFTIVITLLAFVLFFLELVGNRLLGRSRSQAASVVVCGQVLGIEEQVESKHDGINEGKSEGLIEIQGKSSLRAMMKSRIKKLVPKKLRIRKSSMDSKHDMCCEFKQGVVFLDKCSDSKGTIIETGPTLSSETKCNNGELGADLRQNFDCLVLVFIVLVGLIEGRVFALVIALSWCLMLKLQWRNVKFSIS